MRRLPRAFHTTHFCSLRLPAGLTATPYAACHRRFCLPVPAGPLGSLSARGGFTPSSAARAAGGGSAQQQRSAQLIAFSDFCQIVDMQFLTHIRRGTSISVMDFQPSSVPQDLSQALQLLAVTSEFKIG
eukprot:GHRQ01031409.1.p2 GENE.GHRQ01031409.1~~GHRQ01031409.1.p2  ORF type:complete len:129 (-),score=30.29 GHRQ01031409.1:596-982(-)